MTEKIIDINTFKFVTYKCYTKRMKDDFFIGLQRWQTLTTFLKTPGLLSK